MAGGRIKLIIGPMFASKTSTMLADVEKCIIAKKRCVIVRHSIDVRYDHLASCEFSVITHNGYEFTKCPVVRARALTEIDSQIQQYDTIAVSEANLFEDLPEYADKWANAGKYVIMEGLSGDFQRKSFGRLGDVLPIADDIVKLRAVCEGCYADADFTHRIGNDKSQLLIGSKEIYKALCRNCYNRERGANAM